MRRARSEKVRRDSLGQAKNSNDSHLLCGEGTPYNLGKTCTCSGRKEKLNSAKSQREHGRGGTPVEKRHRPCCCPALGVARGVMIGCVPCGPVTPTHRRAGARNMLRYVCRKKPRHCCALGVAGAVPGLTTTTSSRGARSTDKYRISCQREGHRWWGATRGALRRAAAAVDLRNVDAARTILLPRLYQSDAPERRRRRRSARVAVAVGRRMTVVMELSAPIHSREVGRAAAGEHRSRVGVVEVAQVAAVATRSKLPPARRAQRN